MRADRYGLNQIGDKVGHNKNSYGKANIDKACMTGTAISGAPTPVAPFKMPPMAKANPTMTKVSRSINAISNSKIERIDVGISYSRADIDYVVKIILPCLLTDSIRAWAFSASANGKLLNVVARKWLLPPAKSGHTTCVNRWQRQT